MKKHRRMILAFGLLILLSGCGMFKPSEADARSEFEKKWKKQMEDGTVKITKFQKTDGQSAEIAGVEIYTLDYEAEIEFPKGLNPQCKDTSKFSWECLSPQMMGEIRDIGEKQQFKDKIVFEKTEKGWRPTQRGF